MLCAYHNFESDIIWIIDSGVSRHMISNEELLFYIKEGRGQIFTFGNNESVEISGIGKIASFHSPNNSTSTFSTGDAYLKPSMEKSPSSIS